MNYTEKHHLPQWEETDRIMRADFNQMCADMEAGLNTAIGETREGVREFREKEEVLDRRLFRLMYNHYSMLRSMDPFPRQLGVFYENPAADANFNIPGASRREKTVYMSHSDPTQMTDAEFFDSITTVQEMKLVKDDLDACKPGIAAFTAPAAGEIEEGLLHMYYKNESNEAKILYAVLELKNLETGEASMRKTLKINLPAKTTSTSYTLNFKLHFCGGPHQITITPMDAPVEGRLLFRFSATHSRVRFFTSAAGTDFYQTYLTLEDNEECMVILRFKGSGAGGKMTFTWNGEEVEPAFIRKIALDDGRIVQENVYYWKGNVPKNNEFSLSFECGKNSDFWFYDWGGIFC